jgi:hypothetical protein
MTSIHLLPSLRDCEGVRLESLASSEAFPERRSRATLAQELRLKASKSGVWHFVRIQRVGYHNLSAIDSAAEGLTRRLAIVNKIPSVDSRPPALSKQGHKDNGKGQDPERNVKQREKRQ